MSSPDTNREPGATPLAELYAIAKTEIESITPVLKEGETFPGSKGLRALLRAELVRGTDDAVIQDLVLQHQDLAEVYATAPDKELFAQSVKSALKRIMHAIENPPPPRNANEGPYL